jgi:hypothetical protein
MSEYMTPVMFTDPNGYAWKLWEKTKEWFKDTFGFSACKEISTVDYKFLYGFRAGTGYCTSCEKPIVFYSSIPENLFDFGQYSLGIKFTSKSGKGFKLFAGTKLGVGWFGNGSSTTVSVNNHGRIGVRESFSQGNGAYSFAEGEINLPENIAAAYAIVYGIYGLINFLKSIGTQGNPIIDPIYT